MQFAFKKAFNVQSDQSRFLESAGAKKEKGESTGKIKAVANCIRSPSWMCNLHGRKNIGEVETVKNHWFTLNY